MAKDEVRRYQENLRDELDGAALYARIAAAESDPARKELFLQLSQEEARHAAFWRQKLAASGAREISYRPSFRTRLLGKLAQRFGPRFVMPTIAAAEFSDRNKYANQADAASLSADERGHAAVVQQMARDRPAAGVTGSEIAQAEPWHRRLSGNNLRAAVLGANDGLVSNFCLVMGVAGALTDRRTILLTGVAGLVAGACSMGLGEWLSVTNARELASSQIAKEAEEIERTPQAEQRELALIYQAKGVARDDAERIASDLMSHPEAALDTLAREELGLDPKELGGNPLSAAATSFGLFSIGAVLPVAAFLRTRGTLAVALSVAISAAGLFAIGLLTSLFNGRSPWFSALRQTLFGCAAAAVTYGIGSALGVTLS